MSEHQVWGNLERRCWPRVPGVSGLPPCRTLVEFPGAPFCWEWLCLVPSCPSIQVFLPLQAPCLLPSARETPFTNPVAERGASELSLLPCSEGSLLRTHLLPSTRSSKCDCSLIVLASSARYTSQLLPLGLAFRNSTSGIP